MSDPQLSSKAEGQTDPWGAICVTNSTAVQSSWSTCRRYLPTLGLPCQLTCLANCLQQPYTLVSENHHEQVPFPFAAPCHEPKHASSQATTLVETPLEHTIHSLDKTSRKPSNDADKLQSPCSQPRALVQHGMGNKSPKSRTILARSSITGEESLEEQGVLPR